MSEEHKISLAGNLLKAPGPGKVPKVIVVEQPGGIHQIYSNHITMSYTAYDVQLWFGELVRLPEIAPGDEPTNRVEQRGKVTLAWAEAKACRDLLSDQITKFENANGPINPTPALPSGEPVPR